MEQVIMASHQGRPKVWLHRAAIDTMTVEANRKTPLETGGVLLGYWASAVEVVVTACGGPGPHAEHYRHRFRHDQEHDERVIAERFEATEGVETYLGDWHTHPGTLTASPSRADRRAWRRIATCVEARAPRPLAIIVAGSDDEWRPFAFVSELRPIVARWQWLVVTAAATEVYQVGLGCRRPES